MLAIGGVKETSLYVADIERARAFYRDLFELKVLAEDSRFIALDVAGEQVLLLFKRGSTLNEVKLPGGTIPAHDGSGSIHLGFSVRKGDIAEWRERLGKHGVAIESTMNWPRGGQSLYFRDPDGHLLELLTPGVWETY